VHWIAIMIKFVYYDKICLILLTVLSSAQNGCANLGYFSVVCYPSCLGTSQYPKCADKLQQLHFLNTPIQLKVISLIFTQIHGSQ